MRKNALSPAGWLLLATLLALLGGAVFYAVQAWTSMSGVVMSGWGWLFLILGILVSTALGAGLMALVFYSAKHDYDR